MAQAIAMEQIDKALNGFTIPPRPDILKKIQHELTKPEPSIKAIAELINQDVGIAGFTLKVVNSSLFSLPRKITSIEHACMFLGSKRVIKLVNSVVLRFTLSDGREDMFTQRLWNSAMNTAQAAVELAKHFGLNDDLVDDCYTLGLFHNAGMALILDSNAGYDSELRDGILAGHALADHEEELYETSHEVLGFLIAQSWGLTAELSNVIAYHHHPQIILATGEENEKILFCILKLAEHMTGEANVLLGLNPDPEWDRHNTLILDKLDMESFHLLDLGEYLHQHGVSNIYHRES